MGGRPPVVYVSTRKDCPMCTVSLGSSHKYWQLFLKQKESGHLKRCVFSLHFSCLMADIQGGNGAVPFDGIGSTNDLCMRIPSAQRCLILALYISQHFP